MSSSYRDITMILNYLFFFSNRCFKDDGVTGLRRDLLFHLIIETNDIGNILQNPRKAPQVIKVSAPPRRSQIQKTLFSLHAEHYYVGPTRFHWLTSPPPAAWPVNVSSVVLRGGPPTSSPRIIRII